MKNNIKWIAFFIILCVVCLIIFFYLKQITSSYKIVKIVQNSEVIEIIDLSDVQESYEFIVEDKSGGANTIRVENGKIAVIDANCPDKICVKQGFISDGTIPIVCLPHKLTLSITEKSGEYDAIAGGQ